MVRAGIGDYLQYLIVLKLAFRMSVLGMETQEEFPRAQKWSKQVSREESGEGVVTSLPVFSQLLRSVVAACGLVIPA